MSVAAAIHGVVNSRRWTPAELGTLSLWLDADDGATITIDTGVSQWDDKSGNARHATQTTSGAQPSWVTAAQNGLAVVRFAAANSQFLTLGDTLDLGTASLNVAAVVTTGSSGGAQSFLTKDRAGATTNGMWRCEADEAAYFQSPNTVQTARTTATTGWRVYAWQVLDRTSGVQWWRDGTSQATNTTGSPDTTNYNNTIPTYVGARQGSGGVGINQAITGDIGEIIASLAAWTTSDREKVEGYLAWKWGLTNRLPVGHPYKNIQP